MTILSRILKYRIIAIIRGARPEDVLKIVLALHEGGINLVEITINSPQALTVIEKVSREVYNSIQIGAGTVLDGETARSAIDAGAKFIISPSTDIETIQATKRLGAVSIPGAFTATEILTAYKYGGDIIKVFPARLGADYIRDLRAPLPYIPLMPTGGVNLDNIRDFQKAGAVAFGIGSSLVDTRQEVTDKYLGQLKEKAARYVSAIAQAE